MAYRHIFDRLLHKGKVIRWPVSKALFPVTLGDREKTEVQFVSQIQKKLKGQD